ncbi:MAG: DUF177 domain-containing protein [Oligoflexia bacterium]|nr:DUF177 domain-containing protein [Oligoflexia bacterium]
MAAHNLIYKFHEIPSAGLSVSYSQSSGELNKVLFDLLGDFPVYQAQLDIQGTEKSVQVKGSVAGELRQICSRCAEEFCIPFQKKFTTAYQLGNDLSELNGAIDATEGTFEVEFVEQPEVNLGDALHEQIALEIPFQPVCKETCKGLCMQCGKNLNETTCQCRSIEGFKHESPFEKLKALKGE